MAALAEMTTRKAWKGLVDRFPTNRERGPRRKHRRRPTLIGAAELSYKANLRLVAQTGSVLNISKDGLLVKLQEKLALRTPVRMYLSLRGGEAQLAGEVIHCTTMAAGCKIGIQLHFQDR